MFYALLALMGIGGAAFAAYQFGVFQHKVPTETDITTEPPEEPATLTRTEYDLVDVTPANQGGSWKRDYDKFFWAAAEEWDVPFALLKAHAIQESSLNPRAMVNENPQNKPERQGWASRGLIQLLFWPGSDRFEKFGFSKDRDPAELFDPAVNTDLAAQLILANLDACKGNIRDCINMYNTGKKEAVYKAPYNYTDKVYNNYMVLTNQYSM